MKREWTVSAIPALDIGWDFVHRVDIRCVAEEIRDVATKLGWEGDARSAECGVFLIPGDTSFDVAFVWKQDNNGTCFVASPRLLEHLCVIAFEQAETEAFEGPTIDLLPRLMRRDGRDDDERSYIKYLEHQLRLRDEMLARAGLGDQEEEIDG